MTSKRKAKTVPQKKYLVLRLPMDLHEQIREAGKAYDPPTSAKAVAEIALRSWLKTWNPSL